MLVAHGLQRIGTDYTHSHEGLKDVMKKYEEGSAQSGRWAIETMESQEFYYFECPLNGSLPWGRRSVTTGWTLVSLIQSMGHYSPLG